MKYRRNSERNKLTDAILAEIKRIKLKKYPRCVQCGSTYNLQLGHVFTRNYKSTIFEMDNNFIQCEVHNNEHENNPEPYISWVKNEIGERRYMLLLGKTYLIKKWQIWELKELLEKLRSMD